MVFRSIRIFLLSAFITLLAANAASAQVPPTPVPDVFGCSPAAEHNLLIRHNLQREHYKLPPFVRNSALDAEARRFAIWQLGRHQYGHHPLNDNYLAAAVRRIWPDAVSGVGLSWGENTGGCKSTTVFGCYSTRTIMRAWMESAGHAKNVKNPKFSRIGLACAAAEGYEQYWSITFGGYTP